MAVDDLVEKVTIYRMLPLFLHGAIVPFAIIYALCAYYGVILYNHQEYWELFLVFLLGIAILQILVILSCFWSVHVRCFLSCKRVKTAFEGEAVKVVPTANNGDCEFVPLRRYLHEDCKNGVYWFLFQKTKYVWCPKENKFKPLDFPIDKNYGEYMRWKGYVEDSELFSAQQKYGINRLDMIVPEFLELFVERATAPFFVFQVFCVILWCLDQFWYYSLFTLCMLVMFECTLVKQQMRNMDEIRNMGNKPYNMQVYRNKRWKSIASDLLVPGDIVSIGRTQANNPVPCDLLLLRGPCIIDESLLTGESVPQMKEPLENFDGSKVLDMEADGKLHVLFGGTKVVQHTPPSKTSGGIRAQDNGCVAYVLRTGFNTSQGKLLRTILFGVKRVTANSLETLAFILFLLIFAIAASSYVWIKGSEDPKRNRYKLFLECVLILTSVIPPELPVELSLAVNSSLISLARLFVYCTEPFRIPFAGKVQICCFDKTGTLTSNDLIVEGVAGVGTKDGNEVFLLSEIPAITVQVLATCHSLAKLDESLVGDPLEKVTLLALDWNLTNGDGVVPRRGKMPGMKIFHRFHFSSSLKRMSVLTGVTNISGETDYIATVKGAPETLKPMFVDLREDYDEIYLSIARRGARVLALGHKVLGSLSQQQVKEIDRETLESNLHFAGFIIISCPLKNDSKMVVREVLNSSHLVMMITGDNPLTACHVAKELLFTQKKEGIVILVQNKDDDGDKWQWQSIDQSINLKLSKKDVKKLIEDHDLCLTGDGLTYLNENHDNLLKAILPYVSVFARVSPKQKEFIIVTLKALNYSTLMCGDGTNDVGALKHADVGVALIPSMTDKPQEKVRKVESRPSSSMKERSKGVQPSKRSSFDKNNATLKKLMTELEENSANIVKLGDASIAAPFTSKLSSIQCVCHVIKQGRCTLVTTLQMFKILALNALITAYSQSVLFLDGVKFSDTQATLQGLLMAACFLFISRSQPLKTLSKERPLRNIFNVYTISTVLSQFVVHFVSLVFLVQKASVYNLEESIDEAERIEEKEFKPNVMNSTVYIISMALQIATFAINYRGHPYMESLRENTALMISLLMSAGFIVVLTLGITPSLLETLEIVEFDSDHRRIVLAVLFADFLASFMLDRFFRFLFGEGKLKVK